MVKVMTEADFNRAIENAKNGVREELAGKLKASLAKNMGKFTRLNACGGGMTVVIDDDGLVEAIVEDVFDENFGCEDECECWEETD